jgi:hypothetical protein
MEELLVNCSFGTDDDGRVESLFETLGFTPREGTWPTGIGENCYRL